MPLTDAQRSALPMVRAMFNRVLFSYGTAESVEQRARAPAPGTVPPDVTVRVEIAPPSLHPHPILESTGALKTSERVPIYFFTLENNRVKLDSNPDTLDSEENANTHVIFFMHGGGNVTGHPTADVFIQYYAKMLRTVATRSGAAAKCVLIAPSYRLATVPENAFPAALQDVVAAYDYVLGKGYKSSNIVVAGDSAGGNHGVVLTHLVCQSGRPAPKGLVSIAPASILANNLLSDYAKSVAEHDIIDLSVGEKMTSAYVGESGIARADPLVSGAFLPFSAAWPKTLILVGSADLLIDASRELAKRLMALERPVELVEYDERPHGWWILPQIFPEDIQDSVERIARFVLD